MTIYRDPSYAPFQYSFYEVRVYQMPNLIDTATVITPYAQEVYDYSSPENLTTNLSNRSIYYGS